MVGPLRGEGSDFLRTVLFLLDLIQLIPRLHKILYRRAEIPDLKASFPLLKTPHDRLEIF